MDNTTANLCLLKANAIRIHCLAKEQKIKYNKKSEKYDGKRVMAQLLDLYGEIDEAEENYKKSLPWKGTEISMAQGLIYFQHGLILEKMIALYKSEGYTDEEFQRDQKLAIEDFTLAKE